MENYRKKAKGKKNGNDSCKKTYSKEKEDKLRKQFLSELRKYFDTTELLKINPADVPFLARKVEIALYQKMIDKTKYEKVAIRVMNF